MINREILERRGTGRDTEQGQEFLTTDRTDYTDGVGTGVDGSFVLYSVGEDAQDDGGDSRPTEPSATQQSRDSWSGRDWEWPQAPSKRHSYPLAAQRAIADSQRVVAYLRTRADVNPDKLGWFGSSSTGIPGLAVATQGPRLAAVVAFVSTGAYRAWLDTWQPNGLWRGGANGLWPETGRLLTTVDPILHASNLWPTATLLVNGGDDKVVDIRSARAFVEAARPAFTNDPARLRLVNYEGFGHNLPLDVVRDYAERWFRLYLHPVDPPPGPPVPIRTLAEAARQTQINAASHASVVGARVGDEVTRLTSENENRDSSRRHLQDQEPVAIGSRLELFTDDLLVGKLGGCSLKPHEPHPANVALRFDAPWEGAFSGYVTVLHHGERFRCYYRSNPIAGRDSSDTEVTCYAESRDGMNFTKSVCISNKHNWITTSCIGSAFLGLRERGFGGWLR